MHAVDADFAFAVYPFHERARLHLQRVPMGRIAGVGVGQGAGQVLGNVQEEVAALGNVQQLHAAADAEHRHPPLGDQPHQRAVELLAAAVQQPHRRVQHETVDPRIEVRPADQHHAVQGVQHAGDVGLFLQRRNDQRARRRTSPGRRNSRRTGRKRRASPCAPRENPHSPRSTAWNGSSLLSFGHVLCPLRVKTGKGARNTGVVTERGREKWKGKGMRSFSP